ncbi:MAG: AAA family ATPase [Lachnospiraceae bacterium]|nr:AAA family ATPase [Lachnospiraceae bacterium]
MHRNAEKELSYWYDHSDIRPLYITGMRGTGKTTLVIGFAASKTRSCIYINLETNHDLRAFMLSKLSDNSSLADIICGYYGYSPEAVATSVIILDEIHTLELKQEIVLFSKAHKGRLILTDSENVNEYILTDDRNFTHIMLRPLSFGEFLDACGKEWYREVIEGHFERLKKIPDLIHNELNDLYADYMLTGGMPAVVREYLASPPETRLYNIDELQLREYRNICGGILSCECRAADALKLLNGLAGNMASGSYYFNFSGIRKGTSYPYYKEVINKQEDSGILIKTCFGNKVNLFFADPGVMGCILRSVLYCEEDLYYECIRRNCVAADLMNKNRKLSFWRSSHQAYVDFVIEEKGEKIPVKILNKSGKNIRSLHIYEAAFRPEKMFAVGEENFNIMGTVNVIPQYAVFCL